MGDAVVALLILLWCAWIVAVVNSLRKFASNRRAEHSDRILEVDPVYADAFRRHPAYRDRKGHHPWRCGPCWRVFEDMEGEHSPPVHFSRYHRRAPIGPDDL
jgi:hypothetical protein